MPARLREAGRNSNATTGTTSNKFQSGKASPLNIFENLFKPTIWEKRTATINTSILDHHLDIIENYGRNKETANANTSNSYEAPSATTNNDRNLAQSTTHTEVEQKIESACEAIIDGHMNTIEQSTNNSDSLSGEDLLDDEDCFSTWSFVSAHSHIEQNANAANEAILDGHMDIIERYAQNREINDTDPLSDEELLDGEDWLSVVSTSNQIERNAYAMNEAILDGHMDELENDASNRQTDNEDRDTLRRDRPTTSPVGSLGSVEQAVETEDEVIPEHVDIVEDHEMNTTDTTDTTHSDQRVSLVPTTECHTRSINDLLPSDLIDLLGFSPSHSINDFLPSDLIDLLNLSPSQDNFFDGHMEVIEKYAQEHKTSASKSSEKKINDIDLEALIQGIYKEHTPITQKTDPEGYRLKLTEMIRSASSLAFESWRLHSYPGLQARTIELMKLIATEANTSTPSNQSPHEPENPYDWLNPTLASVSQDKNHSSIIRLLISPLSSELPPASILLRQAPSLEGPRNSRPGWHDPLIYHLDEEGLDRVAEYCRTRRVRKEEEKRRREEEQAEREADRRQREVEEEQRIWEEERERSQRRGSGCRCREWLRYLKEMRKHKE
ncbi:hypothetical protein ACMFMG_011614 [Clarireedia jacksonii]